MPLLLICHFKSCKLYLTHLLIIAGDIMFVLLPAFFWYRCFYIFFLTTKQLYFASNRSRASRIQASKSRARVKTLFVRLWILVLFIGFNGYSFYMAAGDIYNTIVVFNPRLKTQGTEGSPMQLHVRTFGRSKASTGQILTLLDIEHSKPDHYILHVAKISTTCLQNSTAVFFVVGNLLH